MALDTFAVTRTKELILSFVKACGPSLPVHIARDVKVSPLFAAAFLSELYREQKLLMSHLKVGSSSLYLLPGQELQLENFIEHLNQREREAFHYIKQNKVINEELLTPVLRVAIKNIQDFALPLTTEVNGEQKTFWRYAFVSEQEALQLIHNKPKAIEKEIIKEIVKEVKPAIQYVKEEIEPIEEKIEKRKPRIKKIEKKVEISLPLDIQNTIESGFLQEVKSWLDKKAFSLIKVLEDNKKDCLLHINTETVLGKQDYLLIAKDKKRLKHEELVEALQKAHSLKMPALVLAKGDTEKKSLPFLQEWRNLIKFEKLKF